MPRHLSEELSEKLRSCVTDDGVILTKKLEKALSYEEQWTLVMAYMSRIRREKLRRDTGHAIAEVKAAYARHDLRAASEAIERVYLSSDTPVAKMTLGEAKARCVELMAVASGIDTAMKRLGIAITAMEERFGGPDNALGDLYSTEALVELVAGMPE